VTNERLQNRKGKAALLLATAAALLPSFSPMPANPRPQVRIVRLDPRFERLVPPGALLERVADGFAWVEGPVWSRKEGALFFSDVKQNTVFRWREGEGVKVFLKPSGYTGSAPFPGIEPGSNGLALDARGRLVLAQHGDRRIVRLETDGARTLLAERYEGRRLNSPNDVVFRANGDLYFTDPPFGLPRTFEDPGKELPFQGVYRLSKDGRLTLLTGELKGPNGIAFSPDEKTLYLTDVSSEVWLAYEVKADGNLGARRVFARAAPFKVNGPGGPDGMKTDREGNLFASGPGGIYVFAPDGTHLGSILTGVATSNCAWGGDGSVLYITADTTVYRIRLGTRGPGFQERN
jgi:gluconolactonase